MIASLRGPVCKDSEARQAVRVALSDRRIKVGWAGRFYAPEDHSI